MDYFENRFYKSGLSVVLVAGAMSIFTKSEMLVITAGILAVVGLVTMFYGINQHNKSKRN